MELQNNSAKNIEKKQEDPSNEGKVTIEIQQRYITIKERIDWGVTRYFHIFNARLNYMGRIKNGIKV